jgi:hypothetical protein
MHTGAVVLGNSAFPLFTPQYSRKHDNIVAYSLKARIVGSQLSAVTGQRPVNNDRGMMFSAQTLPMVAHATMEYVTPSLSNNCTITEERCFLCSPYRGYIKSLVELVT